MSSRGAVGLTYEDLQAFPDDGYRRELLHGQLIVSPSPTGLHQRVVINLGYRLKEACPAHLEVLPAPYDWRIGSDTALEPDLMVIRRSDFAPDGPLVATPLLVVEVLSPSTRDTDLGSKRLAYADAGCPAYWIVDPAVPAVTALSLGPDGYAEVVSARGAQVLEATEPFAVAFCVAELAEG